MRPSARLGDYHMCPVKEPLPHVGGPILKRGAPDVLVEDSPAARGGDIAPCSIATDVVIEGSGTVLIGNMPAARRQEACLHGGDVKTGAAEVFIGGPAVAPPNIDRIVEIVRELDRLRQDGRDRDERVKKLDEYIKGPPEQSPVMKEIDKIIKRSIKPPGTAPDHDDFTSEEAKTKKDAWDEREKHREDAKRDQQRIDELERELDELQQGPRKAGPSQPVPIT
jgi:uncharacterized Zn-binding protein involved in type VI secretion